MYQPKVYAPADIHHSFLISPNLNEGRRYSLAPFALTALRASLDSPKLSPRSPSLRNFTILQAPSRLALNKDINDGTLFHRMGKKLSHLFAGHGEEQQEVSLKIPMKTEVQVIRESSSDDGEAILTGNVAFRDGQGSTSTLSKTSTKSRTKKHKPSPIYIPHSSLHRPIASIEQVYSPGYTPQMLASSRSRAYSIPSAQLGHSPNMLSPDRRTYRSERGRTVQPVLFPSPPPLPTRGQESNAVKQQRTALVQARTHSLSRMVKTMFGGKGQKKASTAVLVSRKSSLKRMKSKASMAPSKAKGMHYVQYQARHPAFSDVDSSEDSSPSSQELEVPSMLEIPRISKKESLPSFLSITPNTAR